MSPRLCPRLALEVPWRLAPGPRIFAPRPNYRSGPLKILHVLDEVKAGRVEKCPDNESAVLLSISNRFRFHGICAQFVSQLVLVAVLYLLYRHYGYGTPAGVASLGLRFLI